MRLSRVALLLVAVAVIPASPSVVDASRFGTAKVKARDNQVTVRNLVNRITRGRFGKRTRLNLPRRGGAPVHESRGWFRRLPKLTTGKDQALVSGVAGGLGVRLRRDGSVRMFETMVLSGRLHALEALDWAGAKTQLTTARERADIFTGYLSAGVHEDIGVARFKQRLALDRLIVRGDSVRLETGGLSIRGYRRNGQWHFSAKRRLGIGQSFVTRRGLEVANESPL